MGQGLSADEYYRIRPWLRLVIALWLFKRDSNDFTTAHALADMFLAEVETYPGAIDQESFKK